MGTEIVGEYGMLRITDVILSRGRDRRLRLKCVCDSASGKENFVLFDCCVALRPTFDDKEIKKKFEREWAGLRIRRVTGNGIVHFGLDFLSDEDDDLSVRASQCEVKAAA